MNSIFDQATSYLDCAGANYSDSVVKDWIIKSLQTKEDLCEILGLTEGNDFTLTFPVEMTEEEVRDFYPYLASLVREKVQEKGAGMFSLKENKVILRSGETKLTRFLNPTKVEIPEFVLQELQCARVEDFLPRLGELGNRSDRELFITANPAEFLKATYNCSYHSCFRYGGEWFSSTVALALDNFTLLSGQWRTDRYKIGRAWMYVLPGFPVILHQKSYGEFSNLLRKDLRMKIEERIDLSHGEKYHPSNWKVVHEKNVDHSGDDDIYFDNFCSFARKEGTELHQVCLDFAGAVCLSCGSSIDNHYTSQCNSCRDPKFTCTDCGDSFDEDDVYYIDGDYYCYNCSFYCTSCENRCIGEHYGTVDRTVCGDCYEQYYSCCEKCGKSYCSEDTYEVIGEWGTEYVCEHCRDYHYTECDECEEYFYGGVEEIAGRSLCTSCRDKLVADGELFVCDSCGEYVEEVQKTDAGWYYCEKCHPNWEIDNSNEQMSFAI